MDDEAEAVREGKTEGFSENIVATVSKFLAVVDNTFEPIEANVCISNKDDIQICLFHPRVILQLDQDLNISYG